MSIFTTQRSDQEVELNRLQEHEEYGMLMSLSLDGLLHAGEEARLQDHLRQCTRCARQWQIWHDLDSLMAAIPQVAPRPGFVERFEARVEQHEQRHHRWLGVVLGVLAIVMWGIALGGVMTAICLLLWNQSAWLGEIVHWAAYVLAGASALAEPIWSLILDAVESPSVLGMVIGYVIFAVLVLSGWTRLLQRTTVPIDMPSSTSS
jgi:anti-sigma factor RsiW